MNFKITKNINEANMITHAGTFHADDVFATAFLIKIIENPIICRINNFNDDIKTDAIVYDIGGGKFDHHQIDAERRYDNDIKYSSIGLLFKEYGYEYIKSLTDNYVEEIFTEIEENLIKQIDAIDNGVFPVIDAEYNVKTLSDIISMFNPAWNEEKDRDELFKEAVEFAEKILDIEINKTISKMKAKEIVVDAIKNTEGSILILDKFMPFKNFIHESTNPKAKNLKFAIFPSIRDGYTVHTIPVSKLNREPRLRFPIEISGLRDKELQDKTGIETAVFVHPDGFIGACDNLEDAIKLANYALYN